MQDDFLNNPSFDEQPSNSKAYWIQGLDGDTWKNLEHYPDSEEALAHLGEFVTSNLYSELRLVSATFSPVSETINYKLLATIADGSVTRPDSGAIISPVTIQGSTDPTEASEEVPTAGDPYAPYAFENTISAPENKDQLQSDRLIGLYEPYEPTTATENSNGSRSLVIALIVLFGIGAGLYLYNPIKAREYVLNLIEQAPIEEATTAENNIVPTSIETLSSTSIKEPLPPTEPVVVVIEEREPVLIAIPEPNAPPMVSEPILAEKPFPDAMSGTNMGIVKNDDVMNGSLLKDLRRAYGKGGK